MHILLGIALALGIVWVLTCTHFGRVVVFCCVVALSVSVIGGIALHSYQQQQAPITAAKQKAARCAEENSPQFDTAKMTHDVAEVVRELFADCH